MNNVVKLPIPQGQANAQAKEGASLEAAKLIAQVCTRKPGETIRSVIARTSITLGWSNSRTEDIWRREARSILSFEMDMLRAHRKRAAAQS